MATTHGTHEDPVKRAVRLLALRRKLPRPEVRAEIRRASGVSQRELATHLGVSATAVAYWESGERNPSRKHLSAYLRVLSQLARAAGVLDTSQL